MHLIQALTKAEWVKPNKENKAMAV